MRTLNFHDYLYHSSTFSLKFSPICVSKKRNNIESMICLILKPSQKIPKISGVSLWPPSSPDHNPLDCAIWGILEYKTNATSHPNIGSLKTAIEEEWNKKSKEFILKVRKSFQRHVGTIFEKKWQLIEQVYCFVSIFLKSKLIL